MNLLFATDSFNGVLSSHHCGDLLESAAKEIFGQGAYKNLSLKAGEGSLAALANTRYSEIRYANTHDSLGRSLRVPYLMDQDFRAYIDGSEVAGLFLLAENERNPLHTSSAGLGEVVKEAIAKGAKEIYLSLEGVAVFDGGLGFLKTFGYRFLARGKECAGRGEDLCRLEKIDSHHKDKRLAKVKLFLLENNDKPYTEAVSSSFLAHTSTKEIRHLLQEGLLNYGALLKKESGKEVTELCCGAGAGGMSGALQLLLEATMLRTEEGLLHYVCFDRFAEEADVVITGKGKQEDDGLTENILARCRREGIPVAFLGQEEKEGAFTQLLCLHRETEKETERLYRKEAVALFLKIREDFLLTK